MDGFHNLLENPHVGVLCVVPGRPDTLRLNGTATILKDPPFAAAMEVRGHRPSLALLIDVEEVFFHCPKAFKRGHVWAPDEWRPDSVRPYAEVALALWRRGESPESVRASYAEQAYDAGLYPST